MEPADLMGVATMEKFLQLRDKLNLTDRQRDVFFLKYSRGLRNIDVANELVPPVNQDTVSAEIKIIKAKLKEIAVENMEANNNG